MLLSDIPSVDSLINHDRLKNCIHSYGRKEVLLCIRIIMEELRKEIIKENHIDITVESILQKVESLIIKRASPSLIPVFNLTGTVLHTNLGRSPLPVQAISDIQKMLTGYCNLEYNLTKHKRGERDDHIQNLICEITHAEAACIVNNNAAAVFLMLSALSRGKEVIVSRGELIEIGGSFRIPDIMKSAGCKLMEVGTTNRTHLKDYEQAIHHKTSLLLKVHPSNYEITGFTVSVSEKDLASLATKYSLPLATDLGSGALMDLSIPGCRKEPTPEQMFLNGCDLVTFSGDKLLGGPQAGIIAGKADLIKKISKHPLKRILRLDKMTLAVMNRILMLYRDPELAKENITALRLLLRKPEDIKNQAVRLLSAVTHYANQFGKFEVSILQTQSQIGSGALPSETMDSYGIAISSKDKKSKSLLDLYDFMHHLPVPIIGRFENKSIILDFRCLENETQFVDQLSAFSTGIKK